MIFVLLSVFSRCKVLGYCSCVSLLAVHTRQHKAESSTFCCVVKERIPPIFVYRVIGSKWCLAVLLCRIDQTGLAWCLQWVS